MLVKFSCENYFKEGFRRCYQILDNILLNFLVAVNLTESYNLGRMITLNGPSQLLLIELSTKFDRGLLLEFEWVFHENQLIT